MLAQPSLVVVVHLDAVELLQEVEHQEVYLALGRLSKAPMGNSTLNHMIVAADGSAPP